MLHQPPVVPPPTLELGIVDVLTMSASSVVVYVITSIMIPLKICIDTNAISMPGARGDGTCEPCTACVHSWSDRGM